MIIGRGLTIGRPLANLLALKRSNANAAVTVIHTGVKNLADYTRQADIIVAAAGSPGMITADMVKPGAAVVAAGVSFDGKKLTLRCVRRSRRGRRLVITTYWWRRSNDTSITDAKYGQRSRIDCFVSKKLSIFFPLSFSRFRAFRL